MYHGHQKKKTKDKVKKTKNPYHKMPFKFSMSLILIQG